MIFINYNKTLFLKSVCKISDIHISNGVEIAFIGYSNAGKSSAINMLANQKKLARSSKTPGRTQWINFFEVLPNFRIVDLPGYGYSKVSKSMQVKWECIIYNYLKKRQSLKSLVLFMDIRNPLKVFDINMITIAKDYNIPILLLLTKCDKCSASYQKLQLNIVCKKVEKFSNICHVVLFSSFKKVGIKKLQSTLSYWYHQYY